MYLPVHTEGALYLHVVRQIEQLILDEQLKPGEKLPGERELAKKFEVSRTVIREAIKTLQQRGLVEIRQGRGIFIIQPKVQLVTDSLQLILGKFNTTMDHLVEAREMLEMAIIRMASARINQEQLVLLDQYFKRMEQTLEKAEEFVFYDMKFHVTLAESAQNPVYLLFMNSILELIQKKSISMALYAPHSMKRAQEHHRAIYLALSEGHEGNAIKALQGHIQQIREDAQRLKDLDLRM